MSTEVVLTHMDTSLLPMELLCIGQFTMGSQKLPNYSWDQVRTGRTCVCNICNILS